MAQLAIGVKAYKILIYKCRTIFKNWRKIGQFFITSQAVTVSAPHLTAIIDSNPVPVPISNTLASSPP